MKPKAAQETPAAPSCTGKRDLTSSRGVSASSFFRLSLTRPGGGMADTRDLKSVNPPPVFDPQKRREPNPCVQLAEFARDTSHGSYPPILPTSCPLFRSRRRAADIADILAGVAGRRAVTEISSNLPGWRNGRRSRLKIDFRKECGFESRPGHLEEVAKWHEHHPGACRYRGVRHGFSVVLLPQGEECLAPSLPLIPLQVIPAQPAEHQRQHDELAGADICGTCLRGCPP